jgi:hypothetical protein
MPTLELPSDIPLRRSTKDRHSSTRYSTNEYILIIDEGELEYYAESMKDEFVPNMEGDVDRH